MFMIRTRWDSLKSGDRFRLDTVEFDGKTTTLGRIANVMEDHAIGITDDGLTLWLDDDTNSSNGMTLWGEF